jgi:non-ribosomal peptide synthetase component F
MQNAPWESPSLEGTDVQPVSTRGARQPRFDLETRVVERRGRLDIGWYYNHDLFDEWRVEQWASQFERVLAQVVEDPRVSLDDLTLLDPIERRELIDGWNSVSPAD